MAAEHFKPVILVCGKTGAGKTSLIQAVTGPETVPDSAIGTGLPVTKGIHVYETAAAKFVDAEGMEAGQTVEAYLAFLHGEVVRRLDRGEAEDVITAVWHCIDGSGGRVQNADRRIVSSFGEKAFVVVTKSDCLRKKEDFEKMRREIGDVPDERVALVSSVKQTGLTTLVDRTLQAVARVAPKEEIVRFQADWKAFYGEKQSQWLALCDAEADSCINWAAGRAVAIAAVAMFPMSDMIPLSLNEAYMIMKIGAAYGESVGSSAVGAIAAMGTGTVGGKLLASFMPPVAKSLVAASVTYGLGKMAKSYFRSGKTLSKEKMREEFLRAKREGKSKNWKTGGK
ncbi:MAG: hypothetical protein IK066_07810 [Kiritimatiellae bacterium]|nr:hypothetical protein [Kiritimatiellia bacterium]